jgi:hypothetical protein
MVGAGAETHPGRDHTPGDETALAFPSPRPADGCTDTDAPGSTERP